MCTLHTQKLMGKILWIRKIYMGRRPGITIESSQRYTWFGTYKPWVNISKFARKTSYEVGITNTRQIELHSSLQVDQVSREIKTKRKAD